MLEHKKKKNNYKYKKYHNDDYWKQYKLQLMFSYNYNQEYIDNAGRYKPTLPACLGQVKKYQRASKDQDYLAQGYGQVILYSFSNLVDSCRQADFVIGQGVLEFTCPAGQVGQIFVLSYPE